jgi:Flp pilus assembly protein TadG
MSMRALRISLARHLRRAGQRWRGARGGNAAVEFALLTPVLMGLLVPIADYGFYIYDMTQVQLAAQAGAEYAARHQWDPNGIQAAVLNATPNLAVNVTPQPFTAASVQVCGCAAGTTITPNPSPAQPCPQVRPICPSGNPAGVYYVIGAQYQFSTMLDYPGITSPQTLSSTAIVRVQ